jgi:hypothetical protein
VAGGLAIGTKASGGRCCCLAVPVSTRKGVATRPEELWQVRDMDDDDGWFMWLCSGTSGASMFFLT